MPDLPPINQPYTADTSDWDRKAKGAESTLDRVGTKVSSFGLKLTATLTPALVGAGVKMFKMAADAEDATSAMGVVFGKGADAIEKWSSKAATSMGMTSTEAKKAATDLAIFGKAGDLAGKDLEKFATEQAQLSADLSSFKGTSVEQAMTAIGAAYRGEMEPIRAYGVLLDQQKIKDEAVRLGLVAQGGELDNNAKLLATRSLIMQATVDQQGDFARTSDGAANQLKIVTAQFKEQATELGGRLIPVGQKLLGIVGGWLDKLDKLSPAQQDMIVKAAALGAALGPVLLIVGKLIPVVGAAVKAFRAMWLVIRLIQLLIVANPIGLIVLAIAALVAGLIYAYNHSEKFRDIVDKTWAVIKVAVASAVAAIIGHLQTMVNFWLTVVSVMLGGAVAMFGWVPGVGPKLREAQAGFEEFRAGVNSKFDDAKGAATRWQASTVRDANTVINKVREVDASDPTVTFGTVGAATAAGAAHSVAAAVYGIPRQWNVHVTTSGVGAALGGLRAVRGYHGGGKVETLHAGGLKATELMAKLERDEYVIRATSARRAGTAGLDHLNRTGEWPGQGAGPVNRISAPQTTQMVFAPTIEVKAPMIANLAELAKMLEGPMQKAFYDFLRSNGQGSLKFQSA